MNVSNSHKLILGILVGSSLSGCAEDFDPASRVTTFRVLAVQADAPFAQPGQTVQLGALSHDPLERPVTWAWAMCDHAADSSVMACIRRFSEVSQAAGVPAWLAFGEGQDTAAVTIPTDALERLPPEARWQASVGVLSVACLLWWLRKHQRIAWLAWIFVLPSIILILFVLNLSLSSPR